MPFKSHSGCFFALHRLRNLLFHTISYLHVVAVSRSNVSAIVGSVHSNALFCLEHSCVKQFLLRLNCSSSQPLSAFPHISLVFHRSTVVYCIFFLRLFFGVLR